MIVCHMTSAHSPEDVRIFHKECVSLAKAGHIVYLVEQGKSYEKNGVHIVGVGEPPSNRVERMTTFSKKVYKAAQEVDADIYHIHDPELLPYGLRLKKQGKKVIFDSHEHTAQAIYEKEWLPKLVRHSVFLVYSNYQRNICKKLDAIISVTPNIVKYFLRFNNKIVQIANYPVYSEKNACVSEKQRRVVFAGGISKQWNHHILLQSLSLVPDCRYCLCGLADNEYLMTLQSDDNWNVVDFMGKVPHAEVANYLNTSMIGVALLQPGRNTDWSNGTIGNTKIFEEMMAGLPVVCTDFVLWREFVERYKCGICVNPSDVTQIADAIQYLLDNPEEAKRMGENGRRAIKEEFNWGVEEKKLLALYEDILNQ